MAKTRKPKTRAVQFDGGDTTQTETMNSRIATENLRERLAKSATPRDVKPELLKQVDQSKVAFSAHTTVTIDGTEVKGWQRVTDEEQKELSQIDPYISAIIATRCSQGAVCGRPSASKFDKGTRVRELTPLKPEDFESLDQFQQKSKIRQQQMKRILEWATSCGTTDKTVLDTAFASGDKLFKNCSLSEFIAAQVRNLLTFGRIGTQIFRDKTTGKPLFFRPVPIETIFNIRDQDDAQRMSRQETAEQSEADAEQYNQIPEGERPRAYQQRIEGTPGNFFTEDDLKVSCFQKQALFGLNGYPLSPIEQAIYMVFIHQQTLGYLRNQFVKGLAAKGLLIVKSEDASAQLSDEDLAVLRQQFNNYASRNDNSAAIPVMSGPISVDFKALSPTPRDMEFLQVEEHVIRALCSSFQISPQEMGYGHLSIGQGGLSQSNKQEEIIRGEERGLRMLLDTVFDQLNEILQENFPEAEQLYAIEYVGVGEDTRVAAIARQQQEIQTTATMSSLYADSEKTEPVAFAGNVPLNPIFHQMVLAKLTYGEFREFFLGEDGARKRPEFDFIIDPNLNQSYQQLKVNPIQMQQEQAQLQLSAQEQQLQMGEAQQQQMAAQQQMAPQGQNDQGGSPGADAPKSDGQELGKTLEEGWKSRERLSKSSDYFRAWIDAHHSDEN